MEPKSDLAALYDQDFYAWSQKASELLRKGCFAEADIEHVAEEIADMGGGRKLSLRSESRRLLWHLLKWQFQPRWITIFCPKGSDDCHENEDRSGGAL